MIILSTNVSFKFDIKLYTSKNLNLNHIIFLIFFLSTPKTLFTFWKRTAQTLVQLLSNADLMLMSKAFCNIHFHFWGKRTKPASPLCVCVCVCVCRRSKPPSLARKSRLTTHQNIDQYNPDITKTWLSKACI